MTQKTYHQTDLRWIRGIGSITLFAATAIAFTTLWHIGSLVYSAYLHPKVEALPVNQSRVELESKYKELLAKAGYRNDIELTSISDKTLIETNRKLELSVRSGSERKK